MQVSTELGSQASRIRRVDNSGSEGEARFHCVDPTLRHVDQGLKVLGMPVGHPECVANQLRMKGAEHLAFLDSIPT